MAEEIELNGKSWTVVRKLGEGGFGIVYEITDGVESFALKVVRPLQPDWRDMLVNDIPEGPFAIPILESAETADSVLLRMSLAKRSLRDAIESGDMTETESLAALADILAGLEAMETAGIVHRDVKPANILEHEGVWKLTDFGEARYAEATTGLNTRKLNMTPAYAAPERWWEERATGKTDVYSWGVIAHELFNGSRPYRGTTDQLREQHLNSPVPDLTSSSSRLNSVVKLSLAKAQEARPTATSIRRRFESILQPSSREGFEALRAVDATLADKLSNEQLVASQLRSRIRRHDAVFASARELLEDLASQFAEAILNNAVTAETRDSGVNLVEIVMAQAKLTIAEARGVSPEIWGSQMPVFELFGCSTITLTQSPNELGYRGRAHSLWYGDIHRKGEYAWFEVAFTNRPTALNSLDPESFDPDEDVYEPLSPNWLGETRFARPFEVFDYDTIEGAASEWANRLAVAASSSMQRDTEPVDVHSGSWRWVGQEAASRPPKLRI